MAGIPICGADLTNLSANSFYNDLTDLTYLAILVSELESVEETEGLVNAAADWEVIDGNLRQSVSQEYKPLNKNLRQG